VAERLFRILAKPWAMLPVHGQAAHSVSCERQQPKIRDFSKGLDIASLSSCFDFIYRFSAQQADARKFDHLEIFRN